MKKFVLSWALIGLLAGGARAGVMLETSQPPGDPLEMSAGAVSGPMLLSVVSDNPPNDIMLAWNVGLEIVGDAGSTGTLTFNDPATGTPANPANYVFGPNGLGIVVTNSGDQLTANDFFDPNAGSGVPVPGSPGANLLQMDFQASSGASGLFGIYAIEGAGSTQWTDANFTTQYFSNVPDGTGMVRIGEVQILGSVPEPSTVVLAGLAVVMVAASRRRRQGDGTAPGRAAG